MHSLELNTSTIYPADAVEPGCTLGGSGMASATGPTAGIAQEFYVGVPTVLKKGQTVMQVSISCFTTKPSPLHPEFLLFVMIQLCKSLKF